MLRPVCKRCKTPLNIEFDPDYGYHWRCSSYWSGGERVGVASDEYIEALIATLDGDAVVRLDKLAETIMDGTK